MKDIFLIVGNIYVCMHSYISPELKMYSKFISNEKIQKALLEGSIKDFHINVLE